MLRCVADHGQVLRCCEFIKGHGGFEDRGLLDHQYSLDGGRFMYDMADCWILRVQQR